MKHFSFLCFFLLASHLSNAMALQGGEIRVGIAGYPKSLLYYLGYDDFSQAITTLVLDPLLTLSPQTNDPLPNLATHWSFSADGKNLTLYLSPTAAFSDRKLVTAHDVKFTWEALYNSNNGTAPFQAYFSSFSGCDVVSDHQIIFHIRTKHFQNLNKLANFFVLPEHLSSQGDFNKVFSTHLFGSGPYLLENAIIGDRVVLKKNPKYWAARLPQNKDKYNFDRVVFRSIADPQVQFEMFKKREIDFYYFLSSKIWATETDSSLFRNGYIKKIRAENQLPYGTMGIAWNLRRALFQDRRVRRALSHLMNREKWIHEFFYDNYTAASGIISRASFYHSPRNQPIPYDSERAKALLKEAGWTNIDDKGILTREGNRFEFDLLTDTPSAERYLTVYQEDLRKVGIKMNIQIREWATALKLRDDRQFDGVEIYQSREIEPANFAVDWSGEQANIKGSGNITGMHDPQIDRLCAAIDQTENRATRRQLVQQLDDRISEEQPISFEWEPKYLRIAYWNKYGFPKRGYFEFSNWWDIFHHWWFDPLKEKALAFAS